MNDGFESYPLFGQRIEVYQLPARVAACAQDGVDAAVRLNVEVAQDLAQGVQKEGLVGHAGLQDAAFQAVAVLRDARIEEAHEDAVAVPLRNPGAEIAPLAQDLT